MMGKYWKSHAEQAEFTDALRGALGLAPYEDEEMATPEKFSLPAETGNSMRSNLTGRMVAIF